MHDWRRKKNTFNLLILPVFSIPKSASLTIEVGKSSKFRFYLHVINWVISALHCVIMFGKLSSKQVSDFLIIWPEVPLLTQCKSIYIDRCIWTTWSILLINGYSKWWKILAAGVTLAQLSVPHLSVAGLAFEMTVGCKWSCIARPAIGILLVAWGIPTQENWLLISVNSFIEVCFVNYFLWVILVNLSLRLFKSNTLFLVAYEF